MTASYSDVTDGNLLTQSLSFPGLPLVWGLALLLALSACGKGGGSVDPVDADDTAVTEVVRLGSSDVATAHEAEISNGVEVAGPLDPASSVVVKAQIDGVIAELKADRGSVVRAGGLLARIASPGVEQQQIAAKAAVASTEAALAVADQNLDASSRLAAAGALSEIDLKSAQAQQRAATAQLDAARAQAEIAAKHLGYTSVTSPIDGAVSIRSVDLGQYIRTGESIVTVVDARILELNGQISVDQASRVRPGQRVVFTLDAAPGKTFKGTVARIDPVADPGTRQVGVYTRLDNSSRSIVAGQYARGLIEGSGEKGRALVVPSSAIRTEADGSKVLYLIIDGRAVRRPVSLGSANPATGMTAVLTGVTDGDQVLATSALIRDGALVELVSADSAQRN